MKNVMNNYSDTAMSRLHPLVIFIYVAAMLVISCVTLNPGMLIISLFMGIAVNVLYKGWKSLIKSAKLALPIGIFMVIIQPLFNHTGSTPVFYINDNPVYLENYIYGIAVWILVCACIQWFNVAQVMIDSEKLLYLVGKCTPGIAMTLAMIFRFIPLLKRRYRQIHEGQAGMGRGYADGTKASLFGDIIERLKYGLKELSILVTWSLESSMEMSLSMENREFGTGKRTLFVRFKLNKSDIILGAGIGILFLTVIVLIIRKCFVFYYLPAIYSGGLTIANVVGLAAFTVLGAFPFFVEIC
ncbi:MAG: energy-coupling factor transporter transmembrane component T [Lachnospira sp.]